MMGCSARLSDAGDLGLISIALNRSAWWDLSYRYRQRLFIFSSNALSAGYAARVNVDHQDLVTRGRSLANGDDVRLVRHGPFGTTTEIDRALDGGSSWNSVQSSVWFRIASSLPAGTTESSHYLYYGNSSAGSAPMDGKNIFTYADSFSSAGLSGITNETIGSAGSCQISIVSMALQISAQSTTEISSTSDSVCQAAVAVVGDFVADVRTGSTTGTIPSTGQTGGLMARASTAADAVLTAIAPRSASSVSIQRSSAADTATNTTQSSSSYQRIRRIGNGVNLGISSDGISYTNVHNQSFASLPAVLLVGPFLGAGVSAAPHSVSIQWLRIRPAVEQEPVVSLSAAEVAP